MKQKPIICSEAGLNGMLSFLQNNTWCIARPSTEETVLQNNIDFACSNGVDCSVLAPGQRCSLPNTRLNHASVVMNLYYSANGRQPHTCSFGNSGLITIVQVDQVIELTYFRANLPTLEHHT
ncbi:hypothetical protein EJ110_NYTH40194 [Nymphaea thermarum]|nr:hypothetical protein EJ110_NYTH40194 [Nymphaea thermarum]